MIGYNTEPVSELRMRANGEWEQELIDIKHHFLIGDVLFVYSQSDSEFEEILMKNELKPEELNSFQDMPEKEFVYHKELFEMIFSEYFRRRTS